MKMARFYDDSVSRSALLVFLVLVFFCSRAVADPVTITFQGTVSIGAGPGGPGSVLPAVQAGETFLGTFVIDNTTNKVGGVYEQATPFLLSFSEWDLVGNGNQVRIDPLSQAFNLEALGIDFTTSGGISGPGAGGVSVSFKFPANTFLTDDFLMPDLSTALSANLLWISPVGFITGSADLESVSAVPEPSALLLLSSGLVVIVTMLGKRKSQGLC